MYCIDFEYDGQRLSDYGCMVCHISSGADLSTVNIGSEITFNTINMITRNKFKMMSTQYDTAYTTTFEIGKFSCDNRDDYIFTQEEVSRLMRWLSKKRYAKFKMVYDNDEFGNIYYLGSFNVQMITFHGDIIGLELTLQTNAPFGYYDPIECNMSFGAGGQNSVYDISDDIGCIYPQDVKIECLGSGTLTIHNSQDDPLRNTVIENCVVGEVLTLDGEHKVITSTNHQKLYNDFNYNFIRISNKNQSGIDDTENIFTSSLPCNISFTYSPVCKAGLVV